MNIRDLLQTSGHNAQVLRRGRNRVIKVNMNRIRIFTIRVGNNNGTAQVSGLSRQIQGKLHTRTEHGQVRARPKGENLQRAQHNTQHLLNRLKVVQLKKGQRQADRVINNNGRQRVFQLRRRASTQFITRLRAMKHRILAFQLKQVLELP